MYPCKYCGELKSGTSWNDTNLYDHVCENMSDLKKTIDRLVDEKRLLRKKLEAANAVTKKLPIHTDTGKPFVPGMDDCLFFISMGVYSGTPYYDEELKGWRCVISWKGEVTDKFYSVHEAAEAAAEAAMKEDAE